ncbi:hypothetical protein BC834DRAFT_827093 [Gloeopeniophorella convolvens]|nr:hypothetical protein BC834DRAFT_827093 [Gloeopeniophorella convolvens]
MLFLTLFSVLFSLFSLVAAFPVAHHHRRNACPHRPASSLPPTSSTSVKPASTSVNNAVAHVTSSSSSASHTSSAAEPSASSTKPDNSTNISTSVSSLTKPLFPIGRGSSSWTTVQGVDGALPIADSTFQPTKEIKALSHNTVMSPGPDSKPAMEAIFPKGSWTFGHGVEGGFSFYAPGPGDIDLTTAREATFGYSVMFEEGWEWNMGGKLPGFFGGDDETTATECSGGRHPKGCMSVRLMWRKDGAGEVYAYLPTGYDANKAACNVPPFSTCNAVYGDSIGRGSFQFKAGGWTTVSERVRLNDVGKENGEIQLFVNGESVINLSGIVLRDSDQGRIRGVEMQTFFGGSTEEWASPKDQKSYFSDFSVAITEEL